MLRGVHCDLHFFRRPRPHHHHAHDTLLSTPSSFLWTPGPLVSSFDALAPATLDSSHPARFPEPNASASPRVRTNSAENSLRSSLTCATSPTPRGSTQHLDSAYTMWALSKPWRHHLPLSLDCCNRHHRAVGGCRINFPEHIQAVYQTCQMWFLFLSGHRRTIFQCRQQEHLCIFKIPGCTSFQLSQRATHCTPTRHCPCRVCKSSSNTRPMSYVHLSHIPKGGLCARNKDTRICCYPSQAGSNSVGIPGFVFYFVHADVAFCVSSRSISPKEYDPKRRCRHSSVVVFLFTHSSMFIFF